MSKAARMQNLLDSESSKAEGNDGEEVDKEAMAQLKEIVNKRRNEFKSYHIGTRTLD